MTKERHSITLSKELSEGLAFLASSKQMNLSEYLETRLRYLPEIQRQITRFEDLPEDPIIDMGKIGNSIPEHIEGFLIDNAAQLTKNIV